MSLARRLRRQRERELITHHLTAKRRQLKGATVNRDHLNGNGHTPDAPDLEGADDAPQNANQPTEEQLAAASVLVFDFAGPGSSEFQMRQQHVTPAQMLVAASWLDWYAKRLFEQATARIERRQPQLIVPQPGVKLHA